MKKKIGAPLLLINTFKKVAPKIHAKILLEPDWNLAGQITFSNGRKRYFNGSALDINPMGAASIAKDKDFASFFMKKMGYPTISGKTFFSKENCDLIGSDQDINAAYRYARKIGFPVIVKPNSWQQGFGVAKVYNKKDFYEAMNFIFMHDRVALVQVPVLGKDYRIVVLDGNIICAYERIPLSVVGDGMSSIHQLVIKKQKELARNGRDVIIQSKDRRIFYKLKTRGLNINSIIPKGQAVFLLDNANLSSGGDAFDVTYSIHPRFKKIAVDIAKKMGLRFCGIDLMVDGDISKKASKYWVLEVNSSPGLGHYSKMGKAQKKIAENMYAKVLRTMESQ